MRAGRPSKSVRLRCTATGRPAKGDNTLTRENHLECACRGQRVARRNTGEIHMRRLIILTLLATAVLAGCGTSDPTAGPKATLPGNVTSTTTSEELGPGARK